MSSPTPATQPGFNLFAILAIIFVWFAGVLGLIFGYIALGQIKRTGERGHRLALAAVIIGWIAIVAAVIIIIVVMIGLGAAVTQA